MTQLLTPCWIDFAVAVDFAAVAELVGEPLGGFVSYSPLSVVAVPSAAATPADFVDRLD